MLTLHPGDRYMPDSRPPRTSIHRSSSLQCGDEGTHIGCTQQRPWPARAHVHRMLARDLSPREALRYGTPGRLRRLSYHPSCACYKSATHGGQHRGTSHDSYVQRATPSDKYRCIAHIHNHTPFKALQSDVPRCLSYHPSCAY